VTCSSADGYYLSQISCISIAHAIQIDSKQLHNKQIQQMLQIKCKLWRSSTEDNSAIIQLNSVHCSV